MCSQLSSSKNHPGRWIIDAEENRSVGYKLCLPSLLRPLPYSFQRSQTSDWLILEGSFKNRSPVVDPSVPAMDTVAGYWFHQLVNSCYTGGCSFHHSHPVRTQLFRVGFTKGVSKQLDSSKEDNKSTTQLKNFTFWFFLSGRQRIARWRDNSKDLSVAPVTCLWKDQNPCTTTGSTGSPSLRTMQLDRRQIRSGRRACCPWSSRGSCRVKSVLLSPRLQTWFLIFKQTQMHIFTLNHQHMFYLRFDIFLWRKVSPSDI